MDLAGPVAPTAEFSIHAQGIASELESGRPIASGFGCLHIQFSPRSASPRFARLAVSLDLGSVIGIELPWEEIERILREVDGGALRVEAGGTCSRIIASRPEACVGPGEMTARLAEMPNSSRDSLRVSISCEGSSMQIEVARSDIEPPLLAGLLSAMIRPGRDEP